MSILLLSLAIDSSGGTAPTLSFPSLPAWLPMLWLAGFIGVPLIGLVLWGLYDIFVQTAAWDRTQKTAFRHAVRDAQRRGATPPDWEMWITEEIDRITRQIDWTRIHISSVSSESRVISPNSLDPASPASRALARIIPFRPRSHD
ncbi:MAG: hypothetical protein C7B45_17550 [Sulfobacillus acidophilus]|uniref:Uncharacterized protein n=1 Tax=Sulfobacillus acidophilus TaxID=53633 RepID=A0A2T2WCE5_9FIRM|nr:MAG: hypothetical protein C7B45_17550 [Sulfobacillus acidophilus]